MLDITGITITLYLLMDLVKPVPSQAAMFALMELIVFSVSLITLL